MLGDFVVRMAIIITVWNVSLVLAVIQLKKGRIIQS